jgi:hypothetical protein
MSLLQTGAPILDSEVTNIEKQGFWLWSAGREYFVAFAEYPAFQDATIAQIHDVQTLSPGQLYWPALDVDLEVEALEYPERFPLAFHASP